MDLWEQELEMEEDMIDNGFDPNLPEEFERYCKWVDKCFIDTMKKMLTKS